MFGTHIPRGFMYVCAVVCFMCARLCVCALVCVRMCPSIRSMSRSRYLRRLACTEHPILCLGLGIFAANRSRPACVRASASFLLEYVHLLRVPMCGFPCAGCHVQVPMCGFPCAAVTRTMRRSYCKHQLTVHPSTS